MESFATAQVDEGQRLQRNHIPDGTGACRACGRPSPCDETERGAELVDRYGGWLASQADQTAAPAVLVSPFATNVGPWR